MIEKVLEKGKAPVSGGLGDLTATRNGGYACRYDLAITVSHTLYPAVNYVWRGDATAQALLFVDPLKTPVARDHLPPGRGR